MKETLVMIRRLEQISLMPRLVVGGKGCIAKTLWCWLIHLSIHTARLRCAQVLDLEWRIV